jgi:3-hydroxyisobutyrate dehydrogenase-like beta-hydroxyacid dehydrogenase
VRKKRIIIVNRIDANTTTLAMVGIGAMGSRMARRFLTNGYKVTVFDLDRSRAEILVADGAIVANSLADIARSAKVILSCLTDDEAVQQAYLGHNGILAHANRGSLILEMSTIHPQSSRNLAREGTDRGMHVLDVAISGSTPVMEQGMVTLLCGGESRVFAAAEPIFKTIAKQYFYMGPAGSGTAAKLVINTLLGVGMQAIAEACVLGEKQGLDREQMLTVMSKTAVVAPAHVGKLLRAVRNDYSPQFPLRLMNKDFRLIVETASNLNITLPVTEAAFKLNSEAMALGPDQDFSIVIREMESRAQENEVKQLVAHGVETLHGPVSR